MLPIKLHVENFTSYINETIDFNKFISPTIITGNNGNGKSSIIDMITTALYYRARGTDSRGAGIDDLITKNKTYFLIDFTFEMNHHIYQIIRKREKSGGHTLQFLIDNNDFSSSIKETQQRILDVMKIDYDTFLDTVCIAQGNSSSFMEKTPDKRKEVFSQVLRLDRFDALEQIAKQKRKEVQSKIQQINMQMTDFKSHISHKQEYEDKLMEYTDTLNNINIDVLEDKLQRILTEKNAYELQKSKNELVLNRRHKLKQLVDNLSTDIISTTTQIETLEDKLNNMHDIDDEYKLLQEKESKLSADISSKEKELSTKEAQLSYIKKEFIEIKTKINNIKQYNKGTCDFCGHQITEAYKTEYITKLKDEGKAKAAVGKQLSTDICDLQDTIDDYNKTLRTVKTDITNMNKMFSAIAADRERLKSLNDKLTMLNSNLDDNKFELEENEKITVVEMEDKVFNDAQLANQIQELKSQKHEYETKIAVIKDRLKIIEDEEDKYKACTKELKQNEILEEDYKSLIHAFGKSGIQSFIIENALPEIEIEINQLLDVLTDGNISLNFIVQKEAKSKKTSIDTLDIVINDEGLTRKYETYSGGEKFRIDFACHVGLARFLTKRADASIDMFILDENLGSQDETAKSIFVKCINRLSSYFKKILIITHINDIKDAFPNKVSVVKDNREGSKVYIE